MSKIPFGYYANQYNSGKIDLESLMSLTNFDGSTIYVIPTGGAKPLKVIFDNNSALVCPCCGALLPRNTIDCFWCDWEGK